MATASSLGTYQNAMDTIALLRENGIDANITVGGISYHPKQGQEKLAETIIASMGGRSVDMTLQQMKVLDRERFDATIKDIANKAK